MEFEHPYLTEQIIAYIGNKRKLLPLIYSALENTGLDFDSGLKFLDVFSGSGVVSRFAKFLGFEVYANDWEFYSNVLNKGYLGVSNSDIDEIFGGKKNFESFLDRLNSIPVPEEESQYIAKYYAPKEFDTEKVDGRTERLFYTRENALSIDKIRNWIEDNLPETARKDFLKDDPESFQKIRNLLTAILIYESATHTNTSGVFKAFHKEFGGHGKDAMKRITAKISLHYPVLIDGKNPVHIFQEDANKLVRHLKNLDVAYLDPPYNQHQYGSNYHMLNTIAKWDKIPAPLELNSKGELKEKAAIRHDWVNTRSNYCYKSDAEVAFEDLIMNIDAKFILISYSTDGIIPFDRMREICTKRGRLSLVTNEYTTYRGGKQSNKRQNSNIEFVLCIDTSKKTDKASVEAIDFILKRKKALLLFKQRYSFEKMKSVFGDDVDFKKKLINFKMEGFSALILSKDLLTFEVPGNFEDMNSSQLDIFIEKMGSCVCETKEEELEELFRRIEWDSSDKKKIFRMIPGTINKLANNKNKESYFFWINKIKKLEKTHSEFYDCIMSKIEKIQEVASRRIKF